MHRVLERQMRKLGIPTDDLTLPSEGQWVALIAQVERTYVDADQDRYTMERSIDISSSEMKDLHRRLASERDTLRSIFESAALGIVRLDPEGRVLDVNAAALAIFHRKGREIEGRPLASLFDDGPTEMVRLSEWPSPQKPPEGSTTGVERRHRRADGSVVWVHVTTNWVSNGSGAIEFGTAILENVTTRKVLEGSLRHAQKLESVGRLAAGVAHEINTPIQFVSDNVQFLKTTFDTMTTRPRRASGDSVDSPGRHRIPILSGVGRGGSGLHRCGDSARDRRISRGSSASGLDCAFDEGLCPLGSWPAESRRHQRGHLEHAYRGETRAR
jgi:PAS domain S-box-containing protein